MMEVLEGVWSDLVLSHTKIGKGAMEKFGICSHRRSELYLIIIFLSSIGNVQGYLAGIGLGARCLFRLCVLIVRGETRSLAVTAVILTAQ
jgi:hypothetical protein